MKASQALDVGSIPITRSSSLSIFFILILFVAGCATAGQIHKKPAVISSQLFIWPVRGRVEVAIKGIVIQPDRVENVVAAHEGRVSFVDPRFRGYGKTILVRHPGDFSTVYAGCAEITVRLGQWVRQGDGIAKIDPAKPSGARGLYFEIRKSAQAVDPLKYLSS